MSYTITLNPSFNSLEIAFDGKPSEAIRTALKGLKFRWHNVKKVWYGYSDEATVKAAIDGAAAPLEIPETTHVEHGGLYDGWRGGNNAKWSTGKELKSLILADCKKAGIPVTVRFGRGGYLTSLTVTITISAAEVKTFEAWKDADNDRMFWAGCIPWLDYVDEHGTHRTIHREQATADNSKEGEKIREACRRCHYESMVNGLTDSGSFPSAEVLTDSARAKFDTVQAIVNSYNKDCSNAMIDYFDRDIYDHYSFKII